MRNAFIIGPMVSKTRGIAPVQMVCVEISLLLFNHLDDNEPSNLIDALLIPQLALAQMDVFMKNSFLSWN